MTGEELKLRRLSAQHLLHPADSRTVVRDLCGVQAQFLSHALYGLSLRCDEVSTGDLVKSWTNRGTMHLFDREDLPLFLHEGRTHFLRPVDTFDADEHISAQRKARFADLIVKAIGEGTDEREALKKVCEAEGMTEEESLSLFDPWGGVIRALCETGRICHKVQEKKAFTLCPPFAPMSRETARLELARRYFTHFGPATVRDAAYFFAATQKEVKSWLKELPVTNVQVDGRDYFYIDSALPSGEMPDCLFLAGFDQLMLGYEKKESVFLPQEHLRSIFTLSGIVRPAVLVRGEAAGWWSLKDRKLTITLFPGADRALVEKAAQRKWGDLAAVSFA